MVNVDVVGVAAVRADGAAVVAEEPEQLRMLRCDMSGVDDGDNDNGDDIYDNNALAHGGVALRKQIG